MGYFPAFIKLSEKKILIVGGGDIAYKKLKHMLDFSRDISIIAKEFSDEMMSLIKINGLCFEQKRYQKGDVKNFHIVIIAVDDIPLQHEIFKESKGHNCLCNAVDSVDYCDFIFPSYIKNDDLTIAISTSGSSPALAKYLRRYISKILPLDISDFLKDMKGLRYLLPKGKKRMTMLDKKAKKFIDDNMPH